MVFCTFLHHKTVEAIVLNSKAFPSTIVVILFDTLHMESHVSRIVRMDAIIHTRLHVTQRVSRTDCTPCSSRAPTITVGRTVLERAVLYQFCIQTAIGCATDIFKEDTNQFITDKLSTSRSGHCLLSKEPHCYCREDSQND